LDFSISASAGDETTTAKTPLLKIGSTLIEKARQGCPTPGFF
jgi:hypothetical protein